MPTKYEQKVVSPSGSTKCVITALDELKDFTYTSGLHSIHPAEFMTLTEAIVPYYINAVIPQLLFHARHHAVGPTAIITPSNPHRSSSG